MVYTLWKVLGLCFFPSVRIWLYISRGHSSFYFKYICLLVETFLGHVAVKIFISLDYFYKMVDSDISKILSKVPKCKETF